MARRVTVLHHDNCFDGVASSAFFRRFYSAVVDPTVEFRFRGVHHRLGNPFEARWFDGDENAVLDFRYTREPNLTWWFDHHITTFSQPEDEAHFRADSAGRKFWDPTAPSCLGFIARIAKSDFGFQAADLEDLIAWADIIDAARFPDAKTAVELASPALKLMTVIENNREQGFLPKVICALAEQSLEAVVALPEITKFIAPLMERHQRSIETLRQRARLEQGTVTYDIADTGLEAINKFILYYLYPDCRYAVGVSLTHTRAKVSVGSNPWSLTTREHHLGHLCERYGGGGHPVVGAITLGPGELGKAREVANAIVKELRGQT